MQILNWIAVHPVLGVILSLIATNLAVQVLRFGLILAGRGVK